MSDQNIPQHILAVRKDDNGYYGTAINKMLRCDSVERVGTATLITSGTPVGDGKVLPAGSEWHPSLMPTSDFTNTSLLDVAKLRTPSGYVYAVQSDVDTFFAACNACCIP